MPDTEQPFLRYLREIETLLADLPRERRETIRRELLAHLEDAAIEQNAEPGDPSFQALVIDQLGPSSQLASSFSLIHTGLYYRLRWLALALGLLGGALGILGALAIDWPFEPNWGDYLVAMILGMAGTFGILGAFLRFRERRAGFALVVSSALVLLVAGAQTLYANPWSILLLRGLAMLLGGELLLASVVINRPLARLPRAQRALLLCTGLAAISWLSPFSYLPNPLGLALLINGNYHYNPHSALINQFATLGDDPMLAIGPRLDRLIGQTGLDPLDPVSPLASYSFIEAITHTPQYDAAAVVEMHYANGTSQRYTIALQQRSLLGAQHHGWLYTGLDRLLAEHTELPGLPFASSKAPAELGPAAPLLGAKQLPGFATALPGWHADEETSLSWLPKRQMILLQSESSTVSGDHALWQIPLNGTPQRQIASQVAAYTVSADQRWLAFLQAEPSSPWPRYTVVLADLEHETERVVGQTDRSGIAIAGEAAYFLDQEIVWRAPLAGGPAERLAQLPHATHMLENQAPLAVSPDGQRIAYRCESDLCLTDRSGLLQARIALGYAPPIAPVDDRYPGLPEPQPTSAPSEQPRPMIEALGLAWSPDGTQLAAISSSHNTAPILHLITASGKIERQLPIGPNGLAHTPEWASNKLIVANTFPEGGRRIIAIDAATGVAYDLSKPRWDAFASLAPDRQALLLWNGRGGLWSAPLILGGRQKTKDE